MVALSLRLFGVFCLDLEVDGVRRPVCLPPRSASLLSLLALAAGRRVHRSELVEAMWQEDARSGSSACLSTALWRLRKALTPWTMVHGDAILGDAQGGLRLREHAALSVDALLFQQATAAALARPVDAMGADDLAALANAVPLYHGDLLVDAGDDWARRERERLRRRFVDALSCLMRHAMARGDLEEAIRRGHHLLEVDPLREDVHRDLMACLHRRGLRAHALQQFEACRAVLRSELAIAPAAETVALYRDMAAQSLAMRDSPQVPDAMVLEVVDGEDSARASLRQARTLLAEAERRLQQLLEQRGDAVVMQR